MAKEKSVTNHQLGVALASLIEKQEITQKKYLQEHLKVLEEMKQLEKNFKDKLETIEKTNISIDTGDLKLLNEQISRSSTEASKKINSSLKSFILNPYVIIVYVLLVISSLFSMWYSLREVKTLSAEVSTMKNYYEHTTEYFNSNPKDWEKVKKWKK